MLNLTFPADEMGAYAEEFSVGVGLAQTYQVVIQPIAEPEKQASRRHGLIGPVAHKALSPDRPSARHAKYGLYRKPK
jgi:hypothetical protein